jgi:hypothetical protein
MVLSPVIAGFWVALTLSSTGPPPEQPEEPLGRTHSSTPLSGA